MRNPGEAYLKTRHNAGSWFVEAIASQENVSLRADKKLKGELGTINIGGKQCLLYLPSSYMNVCGDCLVAVCNFYKILPNELLVAHDDLDLATGSIKVKIGGGHAGHNGLRDIIAKLQNNFNRLRIGIGHPGVRELVSDYVLSKPTLAERELIDNAIARSLDILPFIIDGNFSKAMQQLHG